MTALTSAGAREGAYARPFFSTAQVPLTVGCDLLPPTTAPPLAWIPPLIGGLTPPNDSADALGAAASVATSASVGIQRRTRFPMFTLLGRASG